MRALLTPLWTTAVLSAAAGAVLALPAGGGDDEKTQYEKKPAPTEAELRELYARALAKSCGAACADAKKEAPVAGAECAEGEVCPIEQLEGILVKHEQSWEVVGPLMVGSFAEEDSREGVLGLLAWSPAQPAMELGRKFFAEQPKSFNEDHLIAFTERGGDEFREALHKRVKKSQAGVRAAACLALRGDDVGKRQLKQACRKPEVDAERFAENMVAATALAALGEKRPFAELTRAAHATVLEALDAGDLDRARNLAAQAEYFHVAASYGGKMSVAYLDWKVEEHCGARAKELETADQVFELIERVSPRL